MKRVIALACFLFAPAVLANPTALIYDATDSIVMEFNSGQLQTVSMKDHEKTFTELQLTDFTATGREGGPRLLKYSQLISIPVGTRPEVEIISTKIASHNLKAALSHFQGFRRHCSNKHLQVERDETLFQSHRNAPIVSIRDTGFIGPVKSALISFNPIRLQKNKKIVKVVQQAILRINFVKDSAKKQERPPIKASALDQNDYQFYKNLFLNRNSFPNFKQTKRLKYDLIVAHESYRDHLQTFIQFKENQSRAVVLKYYNEPSLNEVKTYIKSKYNSAAPPEHTLIIGSIDQIPSFRYNGYWSDYPYSLLDRGDFPDLSLGRMAVANHSELNNLLEKVMARASQPRNNAKTLITSGFETTWCQKNLKYIMDEILSQSKISLNIEKLYASDGHRTSDIVNAYNANPNAIIYDGHGNQDGMTEIPLFRNHLQQLTNTTYPVIFDIACLNSKWPSSGANETNFADRMATLHQAGAAGIMASSDYSGGHDLFRHILRSAVFDEQNTQQPYHQINEIGAMIHYGKIKYLEQLHASKSALSDNHMFFYHGDPATNFFQRALK